MTLAEVLRIVARAYDTAPCDIRGKGMQFRLSHARSAYYHFARLYTDCSWEMIARHVRRTGTTAITCAERFPHVANRNNQTWVMEHAQRLLIDAGAKPSRRQDASTLRWSGGVFPENISVSA